MNIRFDPSPNFSTPSQGQAYYGQPRTFKKIVIHWWDDPAKNPSLAGVIATFKKPEGTSAHYIVDDNTVVNMVDEENMAWHAREANPYTIGIEINPKTPGNTYSIVADLVRDICKRRNIAITRANIIGHREVVNTQCPGTIDIDRIISLAKQGQEQMVTLPQKELNEIIVLRDTRFNFITALCGVFSIKYTINLPELLERFTAKFNELNNKPPQTVPDKDLEEKYQKVLKELEELDIQLDDVGKALKECESKPPVEKITTITLYAEDIMKMTAWQRWKLLIFGRIY